MYKAYFTERLLETIRLAEQATDSKVRSVHVRASRYYCALLGIDGLDLGDSAPAIAKTDRDHASRPR